MNVEELKRLKEIPDEVRIVEVVSSADSSRQPTLFYRPPERKGPVPLLVALHTWGGSYLQNTPYLAWCRARGWAMVYPHFRGPNVRPEACGSELVVQDLLDAVEYAKQNADVDASRIYLMGGSGGGHCSLLMAGRAPHVWAGVSAWCPIADLRDWHRETAERYPDGYHKQIADICGGAPGASPAVDEEYRKRSPVTWLANATTVPLDIAAGIHDGHTGSVPIGHALKAFNTVAADERDRVSADAIAHMMWEQDVPEPLRGSYHDPLYAAAGRAIHFRRSSGNTRITIFEGGHDILHQCGLPWLEQQRKGRPATWTVDAASAMQFTAKENESGK